MSGCTHPARQLLHDSIEGGELPEADRRRLEAHLAACSACLVEMQGIVRQKASIRAASIAARSPALDDALVTRIVRAMRDAASPGASSARSGA